MGPRELTKEQREQLAAVSRTHHEPDSGHAKFLGSGARFGPTSNVFPPREPPTLPPAVRPTLNSPRGRRGKEAM